MDARPVRLEIPPGEILIEEYLKPFSISQRKLAQDLAVPPQHINDIVRGRRAITTDTALHLAEYFTTTPQFWLNLQIQHDYSEGGGREAGGAGTAGSAGVGDEPT